MPRNLVQKEPYGKYLNRLRKKRGLTQQQVADRMAQKLKRTFSQTTLAGWEVYGNLPGRHEIPALAEVLGVSIEELLLTEFVRGQYIQPVDLKRVFTDNPNPTNK